MKYSFVLGFLPVFFIERETHNNPTRNRFINVSEVADINDEIQIAHEKTVMSHNYMITTLVIILALLSLYVSVYVFILVSIVWGSALYVLYGTDVGEYRRDINAYRVSARLFAEKYDISIDAAYEHYARVMANTGKYGEYIHHIGRDKVISDLKGS